MTETLTDMHEVKDTETSNRYLNIGLEAEEQGDRLRAIEAYEAAFAADPEETKVCFRLAYNLDLVGEEDEAIHLYEQCIHQQAAYVNALLNLAVLYEDRGSYAQAERCVRQVLNTDPTHDRALMYIKDVIASKQMFIEEEPPGQDMPSSALLDTPVTDFDLSVRTRNALRKMEIRTLADLLRITEAELRSYKNFGEASLEEIKAMLAQRGLRFGQSIDTQQSVTKQAVYDELQAQTQQGDDTFDRSVNELQLSVRARKALALLNIQSIGDLCTKTEAELMGVKNFGLTSLHEIKERMSDFGLSLRTLEV
jgi:DNA-directed RNA polymerase subunit alpha